MNNNIIEFRGPRTPIQASEVRAEFTFRPVRWRCAKHGPTDQVITLYTPQRERVMCLECLMHLLDVLKLPNLPRAE